MSTLSASASVGQIPPYHGVTDGTEASPMAAESTSFRSLREVARLADRGRHALTVDEVRQMQSSGSEWMTYGEVAEYLSVAVGTVRNWVSARKIPYSKRSGMVRFKRGEIDAWLAKTRKGRHHKP